MIVVNTSHNVSNDVLPAIITSKVLVLNLSQIAFHNSFKLQEEKLLKTCIFGFFSGKTFLIVVLLLRKSFQAMHGCHGFFITVGGEIISVRALQRSDGQTNGHTLI